MKVSITEAQADLIRSRQSVVVAMESEVESALAKVQLAKGALTDVVLTIARDAGADRGLQFENITVGFEGAKTVLTLVEKPKETTSTAG